MNLVDSKIKSHDVEKESEITVENAGVCGGSTLFSS